MSRVVILETGIWLISGDESSELSFVDREITDFLPYIMAIALIQHCLNISTNFATTRIAPEEKEGKKRGRKRDKKTEKEIKRREEPPQNLANESVEYNVVLLGYVLVFSSSGPLFEV